MSEQHHQSDPRVLSRRTLEQDHRVLARLLQPGMTVLDAGCGTGAITSGIAERVGGSGTVVGIDRDESLLAIAGEDYAHLPQLSFEAGDVLSITYESRFDIVTASRVLQWISDPGAAIGRMKAALKPGGMLVVLDYNHDQNSWDPAPPAAFQNFYQGFLNWRAANQWDNRMAEHLPDLLLSAGFSDLEIISSNEHAGRGEAASGIWKHVLESIGPQIARAGFYVEADLVRAKQEYGAYLADTIREQQLRLDTVTGRR